MLAQAKTAGFTAALRQYGVKEATVPGPLGGVASTLGHAFLGHPQELLKGTRLFHKGEMLNWRNLFWPVQKADPKASWLRRGGTHALNAFNVAQGTALPAYMLYQDLKNPDPQKGKLTNALGAIGETAGSVLGFPVGGMLGGQALSGLGRRLGEGVGNAFGSRPAPRDMYSQPEGPLS